MSYCINPNKESIETQVIKNAEDIKELKEIIHEAYRATVDLSAQDTSVPIASTNIPADTNSGWLISQNGNLFKILNVVENTAVILFYCVYRGERGERGARGETGERGEKGDRGETGERGERGERGEQGQGFNSMGEWVSGSDYYPYDIVKYNGSEYECILAIESSLTPPDEDTYHFNLFVSKGDRGEVGRGIIVKGDWVSGTPYEIGDLVKYAGVQWLCTQNVTGTTPPPNDSEHWENFIDTELGGGWEEIDLAYVPQNFTDQDEILVIMKNIVNSINPSWTQETITGSELSMGSGIGFSYHFKLANHGTSSSNMQYLVNSGWIGSIIISTLVISKLEDFNYSWNSAMFRFNYGAFNGAKSTIPNEKTITRRNVQDYVYAMYRKHNIRN